ncbi:MAG TPA: DEAD/DEAH box helicase [Candidatus Acidoferrum sp.]|nr:DEAD/DEAH box helicase [Candidatus Acidoferrum sp.]
MKSSAITRWFASRFTDPTPAQAAAWPLIEAGKNVLIVSPTGTGKTFAAFLSVLNELAVLHQAGKLKHTIYCIYVSPLRALSYDLEKNLNEPLKEIFGENSPIRVGLRSGDTTQNERQKQFTRPPHILLTTPESLAILLSQERWLPHLSSVRWLIIDEIHALAENKRGAHMSISLERLSNVPPASCRADAPDPAGCRGHVMQRIGLSATVAPLNEVAQFLVGTHRECEIVDVSASKRVDLRVYSPLGKNPYPPSGYTGQRLIRELGRLVENNRTTLVFTNTRSGAEAASYWLKEALPELANQIECHHASLDRDVRLEVEDRLKRGELRAVVCSTSLELGIDIGSVDLVVMLSTPKGVSRALQRTGRAGHNIHVTSRGLLMATNMNDLVECCATALLARSRQLDPVRLPRAPLDVLAQHLVSMGCIQKWTRTEALALVRGAYPYRDLRDDEFNDVLDFLAGGGKALRQQYTEVFGKIHLDDESFETRTGTVRRDLLQNMGVIPSEGMVAVRLKRRTLGNVEEIFLSNLQLGDVFIIAGRAVKLERVGSMECFVTDAKHATPTVPRWNANKMPLTNKVAEEIVRFRTEIRARLEVRAGRPQSAGDEAARTPCPTALTTWIAERLDCGRANADIICRIHAAQHEISEIPTSDFLLVEELHFSGQEETELVGESPKKRVNQARQRFMQASRHYFFHTLVGRAANEALSRVVAQRLSRLRGGNAVATPDDYGFVLTVTAEQHFTSEELPVLLSPENFARDLDEALSRSHLLKHHFRNAAQAGMMVYRNYFGERKSVRKLQWSSEVIFNVLQQYEPDHVLMREAKRDAVHTYIDIDGAIAFLTSAAMKPMRIRPVYQVPPLSFALFVTKIKEALLVEDPRETSERLFNLWWSKIEAATPIKS